MARPIRRSPSIESRKEEEESESSDQSGDEATPVSNHPADSQLFRNQDGKPVRFAFHQLTPGQDAHLKNLVEANGGEVTETEDTADTVICVPEKFDDLKYSYDFNKKVYVEEISFIRRCIKQRKYQHVVPLPKGMGGRPGGKTRFDESDIEDLCFFLSQVVPHANDGGRTGRGIYQKQWNILSTAKMWPDREYEQWILRHSPESWRCYYKTHRDELIPRIANYAKQFPPEPDGNGQYHLSRRYIGGNGLTVEVEDSDEEVEVEVQVDDAETGDNYRPLALAGRRRRRQDLSFVSTSRISDPHPAKRRRVDSVLTRVSDMEFGRTGSNRNQPQHQDEGIPESTLLNDPNFISFEDDWDVNYTSSWRGPGPEEAGPSGTQRTPTPLPNEEPTVVLPDPIAPPRAKPKAKVVPLSKRQVSPPLHTRPTTSLARSAAIMTAKAKVYRTSSSAMMPPPPAPTLPKSSQATLVEPVLTRLSREAPNEEPDQGEEQDTSNRREQAPQLPKQLNPTTRAPAPVTVRGGGKKLKNRQAVPQDAPSRNTRARSRSASVELPHAGPAVKKVAQPVLEPVGEGVEERDGGYSLVANVSEGDSQDEEAVEVHLQSSLDEGRPPENNTPMIVDPAPVVISSRHASHDDVIINRNLSFVAGGRLKDPDYDDLRGMLSIRESKNGKNKSSIPSAIPDIPASRTRSHGVDYQTPVTLRPGTRKMRGRPERNASDKTTDEEEFPSPGTRAGVYVERVEALPYSPPPGTRAAEVRKRRDRW